MVTERLKVIFNKFLILTKGITVFHILIIIIGNRVTTIKYLGLQNDNTMLDSKRITACFILILALIYIGYFMNEIFLMEISFVVAVLVVSGTIGIMAIFPAVPY